MVAHNEVPLDTVVADAATVRTADQPDDRPQGQTPLTTDHTVGLAASSRAETSAATGPVTGLVTGPQSPRRRALDERVKAHIVGAVCLALSLAALWLVWMLARPIGLLLAAIIVANALEPLADWLARFMRRSVAIAAIYLTLFALVALAIGLVIPAIRGQIDQFTDDIPALMERGQQLLNQWGPMVRSVAGSSAQSATGGGSSIAMLPLTIASSALEVVLVIFLSLYWLIALPVLRRYLLSLLRPRDVEPTRRVLHEVGETMGGYVRGVILEAALIGTLVFIGMWLVGVRYPALLAVLAAFGELVPYVGPLLAAVPAVVLALFESPTQALIVLGVYLLLQIVESYILFPLVVGSQSDIPPLLIIVGLLAGGAIGGVLGALVAIPVAGALRVVFLQIVAPAIRERTGGLEGLSHADAGDGRPA